MTTSTSASSSPSQPLAPHRSRWRSSSAESAILTIVVLTVFNSVLTGTMVNVLLPDIRATFSASTAQISWVITAYALMYAIGIPLFGRLSDVVSVRTLFTVGLGAFAVGSGMSAVAPNLLVLVAGRLVQGMGGAAVPALSVILIARLFPGERRGAAMGLMASAVGVGSAIGPFVGGFIGGAFGWRWLFAYPLVMGLGLIWPMRRAIPAETVQGSRGIDLIGGALLGSTVGLVLYGITATNADTFASTSTLVILLATVVSATALVWRTRTSVAPFVPPALMRNAAFMRITAIGLLTNMTYVATLVLVPLMLVEHNDLSTSRAGLALTPAALAVALLSRPAGRRTDRLGARRLVLAGGTLQVIAAGMLTSWGAGSSAVTIALIMALMGAGAALIIPAVNTAASQTLATVETGVGMGLFSGASFLGNGIGAALVGAWLNIRQQAGADALNPLHDSTASPWSDAFLLAVVTAMATVILAWGMQSRRQPD